MNWFEIKPVVDLITYRKNSELNIFFYKVTDSSCSENEHICHFFSNVIYKEKGRRRKKEKKKGGSSEKARAHGSEPSF